MKQTFLIISLFICFHGTETTVGKIIEREKTVVRTIEEEIFKVTITMYQPTTEQCDDSPLTTADGSKIDPNKASEQKMVALSRDLLAKFKYGDLIEIKGAGKKDGIYRVSDTMAKRIRKTVDILETCGTDLYKFNNVTITKWTKTKKA